MSLPNPDEKLGLFGQAVQPWDSPPDEPAESIRREREKLLASLARSELGTIESRVALLLQKYPETRDSDIELAIKYWTEFEADALTSWTRLSLEVLHELQPMPTLVRCRQRIQNDFALFVGTRRTRGYRDEKQLEFYRYLAEKREEDTEICFYLDETGTDTTGRFVGVGGVCVLDARAYEMRHASFKHWRGEQGWAETLHFADMDAGKEPKFFALLTQLQRHRAGLMFVGYAMLSRGNKFAAISTLLVQLVGDALAHADRNGCLGSGKSVRVVKEAAEGFDSTHLAALEHDLSQHLLQQFPNRTYLRGIETLPKGREVLIECADLVAAGMKRRWESGHSIHKDRVAEAVMNVTGFEDRRDGAPLFKLHTV